MGTPDQIRVLTVDDHPLLREGLVTLIDHEPEMRVVAQAASGAEAIEAYRTHRPDVTLMDLRLPDMSGIAAIEAVRSEFKDARIVVLTTFEGDAEMKRALEAGAASYFLKSMPPAELLAAIRTVHSGRKAIPSQVVAQLAEHMGEESLTSRELEVLHEVAAGHRNREIGERLFIAEETVKVHLKHILEKLGASDRTQAVSIAVRRGIIQL